MLFNFKSMDPNKSRFISWAKANKVELPENHEELDKVQKIDISLRGLNKIPREINCLPGLIEINAEFNEITELPWEFSQLKKLKVIKLNNNKLLDLPGVICQLPMPEVLDLHSNSIKKVSAVVANLQTLKEIDLSFNYLSELPSEIAHLKHLMKLNVAGNSLMSFPQTMYKLYNLVELTVWKNNVEIPDFIKELPNLKTINNDINTEWINQQFVGASITDDIKKAEKLLEMGADINYKLLNFEGQEFTNALFEARSIDMIKLLLEKGADIKVQREAKKEGSSKIITETFLTKKYSPEILKFIKTLNLQ